MKINTYCWHRDVNGPNHNKWFVLIKMNNAIICCLWVLHSILSIDPIVHATYQTNRPFIRNALQSYELFYAIAAHVGFDLIEFLLKQHGQIWFSSWNLRRHSVVVITRCVCRVPSVLIWWTTWPSKQATHRTFIQTQKHYHRTLIELNEWVEFVEKWINTKHSKSINLSSWIECCRAHGHYMMTSKH